MQEKAQARVQVQVLVRKWVGKRAPARQQARNGTRQRRCSSSRARRRVLASRAGWCLALDLALTLADTLG